MFHKWNVDERFKDVQESIQVKAKGFFKWYWEEDKRELDHFHSPYQMAACLVLVMREFTVKLLINQTIVEERICW